MADKAPKRKTNAKRDPAGVLGTLPASRPERIGRPRAAATEEVPKPRAAAKRKPAAAVKPAPRKRPAAKPAPSPGPAAVSPGAPALQATDVPPPTPLGAPKGTELVTTSIRAVGELAQIGAGVGKRVLKRTIDRIPRP